MSGIKFLKNFIKNPTTVGAVWPTGPALAQEIIRDLDSYTNKNIVEIGPGTGAVTQFILNDINKNNNFFAVELNPEFYDHLRGEFPTIKLYNDNAANLSDILAKMEHISELDAVISGLPWASFPEKIQIAILDAVYDNLKSGGIFNTFAYLQGLFLPTGMRFRKLLNRYFSKINTSRIVWNNIPPAIVYQCTK